MSRFIPLVPYPTQTLEGMDDDVRSAAPALPEGARLRDHEIVGCIGQGGFGVVYLAWDPALAQHIAIKEYLPAALASRASASPSVVVRSQRHMGPFRAGLRSFMQEARTLAQFDHPALVCVLDHWEANGTAYIAMPYYVGTTLGQAVLDLGRPPDEATLRGWLGPLLDALDTLHAADCLHRDIAPDNILLTQDGPVLLDFGAARRVVDDGAPGVVVKPGFTPIEQYGQALAMPQGPWTDLYALAAVVYAAITGQPPPPATERLMDDRLQPLAGAARGRYGADFLAVIDSALAVHPDNRPQDVAAFRKQLEREASPAPAPQLPLPPWRPAAAPAPAASAETRAVRRRGKTLPLWAGGVLVVALVAAMALWPDPAPVPAPAPAPAPAPSREAAASEPVPALAPVPVAEVPTPVPPPVPVPPPAVLTAPATRTAPREARKPVAPRVAAAPERAGRLDSRCAELLQRASLEPLRPGEAAFLRKECQ